MKPWLSEWLISLLTCWLSGCTDFSPCSTIIHLCVKKTLCQQVLIWTDTPHTCGTAQQPHTLLVIALCVCVRRRDGTERDLERKMFSGKEMKQSKVQKLWFTSHKLWPSPLFHSPTYLTLVNCPLAHSQLKKTFYFYFYLSQGSINV